MSLIWCWASPEFLGNLLSTSKSSKDLNTVPILPITVTRKCYLQCMKRSLVHQTSLEILLRKKEILVFTGNKHNPKCFPTKRIWGSNTYLFIETCKNNTVMVIFTRSNPPQLKQIQLVRAPQP